MGANTPEAAVPDTIQELTDRLTASYAHLLTAATVRDVVQDCYQPLSKARIPNYVPILVEHNSLRGLAFSGQASDCLCHAANRNFSYSAWTSRGGR